jgi:hypothetical protein
VGPCGNPDFLRLIGAPTARASLRDAAPSLGAAEKNFLQRQKVFEERAQRSFCSIEPLEGLQWFKGSGIPGEKGLEGKAFDSPRNFAAQQKWLNVSFGKNSETESSADSNSDDSIPSDHLSWISFAPKPSWPWRPMGPFMFRKAPGTRHAMGGFQSMMLMCSASEMTNGNVIPERSWM